MILPHSPSKTQPTLMSTIVPAILALVGLGMFAGSLWLQEADARTANRREGVPVTAPAEELDEEEMPAAALSQYPAVPR